MKEAPPFAPFDEMVLSTREIESEGQTLLKLEALGSDVEAVAAKVTEMKQMVEQGIAEMEGRPQPGMGPILKIMKGLRFYSMGLNATISAKFDGNPANIFSMLMPLLSVRSEVRPGPRCSNWSRPSARRSGSGSAEFGEKSCWNPLILCYGR